MKRRNILFLLPLIFSAAVLAAPPATVTRSDWNWRLAQFEQAYAVAKLDAATTADLQPTIDSAFNLFFGGQPNAGIKRLNAARALLRGPTSRPAVDDLIDALQVQVVPSISRQDRTGLLRVRVLPIYPPDDLSPMDLTLTIRSDADASKVVLSQTMRIDPAGMPQLLNMSKPAAAAGKYRVDLVDDAGTAHRVGAWFVVPKSLDALRFANEKLLSTTRPADQAFRETVVLARSRNALLSDGVDLNDPSALTNDPLKLTTEISAEVRVVMKGQSPYYRRVGGYWRGVAAGTGIIPARVYAPQAAAAAHVPLVVCLPDLIEDENTWFDLLGAGQLQKLADQNGLLIFCARTVSMLSARQPLGRVIAALSEDYSIDPRRVYVIGAGMGATAAVDLVHTEPELVAKLALIGGGEFGGVKKLPPTLIFNGALDAVYTPQRAGAALEHAQITGLPVELRTRENIGQALLLNETLAEALRWFGQ